MADNFKPVESLEIWLTAKPFWEQLIWKLAIDKESPTDPEIQECYGHLCEHLGLAKRATVTKPSISFKNEIVAIQEPPNESGKIKLSEIKEFSDVNAISKDCSIKVGPHLTLIYGANGSGKSGIGRLLCNACFSRGEREVLPNARVTSDNNPEPGAIFVVQDEAGSTREIDYVLGDNIDELKRFAVFDSESVLIHLDQSNQVNFIPAQIKVFDRAADIIGKLEQKLDNDRNARRKGNPFASMFLDQDASETAVFCKSITAATTQADLLKHANFDEKVDGVLMVNLGKKINEMRALDIPKKKRQLANERQNLEALKATLQEVIDRFTAAKQREVNQLVDDIIEKKKIAESLSVAAFNDGLLQTIGSPQWRALITAAKELYEAEDKLTKGKELTHCVLCHQQLTQDAQVLFGRYWKFLENKVESELAALRHHQNTLVMDLRLAKSMHPRFLDTDAGVEILLNHDAAYLTQLKSQFGALGRVLVDWGRKIENLEKVTLNDIPKVDLKKIDNLIAAKKNEEGSLIDPTAEIAKLIAQRNGLKHRRAVTAVKDAALEYLAFLQWSEKAAKAGFAGIKMATTKKRTESFLVGVGMNYKGVFNQELARLDCDFNLVMNTSGEQGRTVKEYRLDFAEDYNPSQILSEGEQNACSLADFLTEVQLDKNNCGIIFDDPVTSLDHGRKSKIAKRLVEEAGERQVVVFTHDIVFMSQLVKHAEHYSTPAAAHWMRKVGGIPGHVEHNTSPRLSSLSALKNDSQEAVKQFSSLGAKEQERALGAAFDYLRSATEAMIEEVLFADTIQRYDDHIRVTNLEEMIFDPALALQIVELHGRISEVILAHNRSDQQREDLPDLDDLETLRKDFDALEAVLRTARKAAIDDRKRRRKDRVSQKLGW